MTIYSPIPKHWRDRIAKQLENLRAMEHNPIYRRLAIRSLSRTIDDMRALGYDAGPLVNPKLMSRPWCKSSVPIPHAAFMPRLPPMVPPDAPPRFRFTANDD